MDIQLLQHKLNSFPFVSPKLDEDGLLGPATERAVKQFQKANNLAIDGIIGIITLKTLNLPSTPQTIHGKYDIQPFPKDNSLSLNELSLQIALSQEGVKELTGKNDGPAVETYLKSIGLGKGYSWCAAFVYWCFEQASITKGAENPLVKTGGVLYHWKYNTKGQKILKDPKRGDIFIMDMGHGLGHTGIVTNVSNNVIDTIEGNTNEQNSREGNGVFKRKRNISNIKGYIRYS